LSGVTYGGYSDSIVVTSLCPPRAHFLALVPSDRMAVRRDPDRMRTRGVPRSRKWHAEDKALGDDNAVGVSAVGDSAQMLVGEVVVRVMRGRTVPVRPCTRDMCVGVYQTANRGQIAGLEFGDSGANLGNAPDDLMARDARINVGMTPLHSLRT